MSEFKPHDYFKADDQGYISRKVFIEHVRNSYDHMRELSSLIKGYDQTIDTYLERWNQNLESLDDDIIGLLHEWIDDSTFATIINEEIFKTKADQVELDEVTAQLAHTENIVDTHKQDKDIHTPVFIYERLPSIHDHENGDLLFVYDNLIENTEGFFESGTISLSGTGDGGVTSLFADSETRIRSRDKIKMKASTRYLLKFNQGAQVTVHFTGPDGLNEATSSGWQLNPNTEIVTPSNVYYAYILLAKQSQEVIDPSFIHEANPILVEMVR